ncbi:MAG: CRISPR-associated helicase Cas3' [Clostridia bacterium]|nr:CRISPR-associated helicase Cas3' [Clostridia bacterium]
MKLSAGTRFLWAKKGKDDDLLWLPLITHLEDSAALAGLIWDNWLSRGAKLQLATGANCDEATVRKLMMFVAAAHDIGKATPVFQAKTSMYSMSIIDRELEERIAAVIPIKRYNEFISPTSTPHAFASQVILEKYGFPRGVAVVAGAHHGKPPTANDLMNNGIISRPDNFHLEKEGKSEWEEVWLELIDFALKLAGFEQISDIPIPDMPAQVLLTGLLIMIDWIASNEAYFPYIDFYADIQTGIGRVRAQKAFERIDFLKTAQIPGEEWSRPGFFSERFGFEPRPLQVAAVQRAALIDKPGLFIIEGSMGIGKTEAALAVAEVFCNKAGRSGVYFALPTQATSDGIFPRILDWLQTLRGMHSVNLVHAKAQFNERNRALTRLEGARSVFEEDNEAGVPAVAAWFEGQKKSLLADFAVGTIDRLLQAALKQKHVMLRHLGLANKVVIVDECHAYDAYMSEYLEQALRWLGAYGVPVILLSATLPADKARALTAAYLGRNAGLDGIRDQVCSSAYPRMTYTDGDSVQRVGVDRGSESKVVHIERLADRELIPTLANLLKDGGCAGVIVNSVKRAQTLAVMLRERFGEDAVRLLHSRFTATDRLRRENELLSELGKPQKSTRPQLRIVVGTQVLEQSLDIDFDLMFTDLCPMDLLLQRIGRLHRHERIRPSGLSEARCFVMGAEEKLDPASSYIYGEYLLMRTRLLLPQNICLPDDISPLVEAVYGGDRAILPDTLNAADYDEAEQEWNAHLTMQSQKAKTFMLKKPSTSRRSNLVDWLNVEIPVSEAAGEAAVRDSKGSVEVIAVRQGGDGCFYPLSGGEALPLSTPDGKTAMLIARECLRLPNALAYERGRDKLAELIYELETLTLSHFKSWLNSPWLKESLILPFGIDGKVRIMGHCLWYDGFEGLKYIKEELNEGT